MSNALVTENRKLSVFVKDLRSRSEFVRYVMDHDTTHNGSNSYNLILHEVMEYKRDDKNPRGEYLCDMLKEFVKEPYRCLEAKIDVCHNEYDELFLMSNTLRVFYVWIQFDSRQTINKMKLMYPELIREINIS